MQSREIFVVRTQLKLLLQLQRRGLILVLAVVYQPRIALLHQSGSPPNSRLRHPLGGDLGWPPTHVPIWVLLLSFEGGNEEREERDEHDFFFFNFC